MGISDKMVEDLVKGLKTSEDLFGKDGLVKELIKKCTEKMLETEMSEHLGYEKYDSSGRNSGNSRNGYSSKKVQGSYGEIDLSVPRDREGEFSPIVVPKGERRTDEFSEKILYFYSTGLSTRDIQKQVEDLYGVEVSPTLISKVTDSVIEEVKSWKSRPLESVYPIVYLDAMVVKAKEDHRVINKAVYLALGINLEGKKEILGMWQSKNEGAKFWLGILTELKNRGLRDIFIACVDGLTGFPEAIEAVYPETTIQLCIVHMVRNSLKYVSYKDRKVVAQDLKKVYRSRTIAEAELALDYFCDQWDNKYPTIGRNWHSKWNHLSSFFEFPEDIRKIIYTTNAIESVNMMVRKVIKNKRVFPNDDSIDKIIFLALSRASKRWTRPINNWKGALNQFAIRYEGRM